MGCHVRILRTHGALASVECQSSAVFSSNEVGSTQSGWLPWDDYVRVRAPGCYGIQVDGLDFSYIIRFKVIDTPYIPEG